MPDWDMNGDTTKTGYEARISALEAELDQASGVIADRNKEIADLIHDLDTAKSNTGEACATVIEQEETIALIKKQRSDALRIMRQSYVTLAFGFRRLRQSARSRGVELCVDFQKVRAEIEIYFREVGAPL